MQASRRVRRLLGEIREEILNPRRLIAQQSRLERAGAKWDPGTKGYTAAEDLLQQARDALVESLEAAAESLAGQYSDEFETTEGLGQFRDGVAQCLSSAVSRAENFRPSILAKRPEEVKGTLDSAASQLQSELIGELERCVEEAFREARIQEREKIVEQIQVGEIVSWIEDTVLDRIKKVVAEKRAEVKARLPKLIDEARKRAKTEGPSWVPSALQKAKNASELLQEKAAATVEIVDRLGAFEPGFEEGELAALQPLAERAVEIAMYTDAFSGGIAQLSSLFNQGNFEGYMGAQASPEMFSSAVASLLPELQRLSSDDTPIPEELREDLERVVGGLPVETVGDFAEALRDYAKEFLQKSSYPIAKRNLGRLKPEQLERKLGERVDEFFEMIIPERIAPLVRSFAEGRALLIKDELRRQVPDFQTKLLAAAEEAAEQAAEEAEEEATTVVTQATFTFTMNISMSVSISIQYNIQMTQQQQSQQQQPPPTAPAESLTKEQEQGNNRPGEGDKKARLEALERLKDELRGIIAAAQCPDEAEWEQFGDLGEFSADLIDLPERVAREALARAERGLITEERDPEAVKDEVLGWAASELQVCQDYRAALL